MFGFVAPHPQQVGDSNGLTVIDGRRGDVVATLAGDYSRPLGAAYAVAVDEKANRLYLAAEGELLIIDGQMSRRRRFQSLRVFADSWTTASDCRGNWTLREGPQIQLALQIWMWYNI